MELAQVSLKIVDVECKVSPQKSEPTWAYIQPPRELCKACSPPAPKDSQEPAALVGGLRI